MLSGSASCSHPHPPRPQLQCVFDACDTTGSGLISLRQLANVSRSHVNGATQVLAILKSDIGPNGGATINVLLCLDRWSRSWTYLTLGKTGLKTTNSTSVSFTQRCGSLRSVFFWFKYLNPQVLAFLNSSGEDEKMVRHGNNSMKERRKSLSNSGSGPNSSNSNFGQRRKSLTNSSSSNMMGERRSSFSNISGHSPPSSTLSPPPAVQVLLDLVKMLKSLTCFSLNI